MYFITSNNEKFMSEKEKIKVCYATNFINNGADFDQEISLWIKCRVLKQKKYINSWSKRLKYISDNNQEVTYPNIKKVMSILLTTAAERANSALCFIKTDYRSTMPIALMHLFCCMHTGT